MWDMAIQMYSKLPSWAKTTSFFVVLFLYVYTLLAPMFVDVEVVAQLSETGFIPYRGGTIKMLVDGRTMKYSINEDGYGSIPIISRLQSSVNFSIFHEDAKTWHKISIRVADIWERQFFNNGSFRIIVKDNPPNFQVAKLATTSMELVQFAEIIEQTLLSTAFAEAISSSLDRATDQEWNKPFDELSYPQKVKAIMQVERKTGRRIPDEQWKNARSIDEVLLFDKSKNSKTVSMDKMLSK